jgi:hypothetical protein
MTNLCIERVASARVRAGLILSAALLGAAASASAEGGTAAAGPKAVAERNAGGGVRVALEGGVPWSAALLRLESGAGAIEQSVVLDAAGRWERELSGFDPRAAVALSFRARGDALSASATVAWKVFVPGLDQAGGFDILQGKPVIAEFMKDPTHVGDTAGEWVEIYNAGDFDVNLEGWALADAGSNFHVISLGGAGLIVPPGGRVVLGNNADPLLNGGVPVDYKYTGP